jgi:ribosomal protein L40E
MDLPSETIILIVAVLIVAAVAYLQLRYIRSHKQTKLDGALEQDDAYNAVATTKAVAASLRQAGRDTTEGDLLIYQAESAYERREFTNCLELADRAKTVLRNCKEKDLLTCPIPPPEERKEVEAVKVVPANETRKLPQNYLESKFVIDTVRDMMPQASPEQAAEAQSSLDLAQTSFDNADYTEALKQAMKAKRALGGAQKTEKAKTVTIIGDSAAPKVVSDRCHKCGAMLAPDDEFCHACGSRKNERVCPSCSREASPEDAFCRKCGAKIGP